MPPDYRMWKVLLFFKPAHDGRLFLMYTRARRRRHRPSPPPLAHAHAARCRWSGGLQLYNQRLRKPVRYVIVAVARGDAAAGTVKRFSRSFSGC